MYTVLDSLSFLLKHPLNRGRKLATLRRFLAWQVGSRLLPGSVALPFVDSTRLLVAPGMTGATGNIYCGLHEFEDMAFVLHALREGDLFADVGANVGTYTVLAAGAARARCLSFEPHPQTFERLMDNIRLNNIQDIVRAKNMALGATTGTLAFTAGYDTMNHVLATGEISPASLQVPVEPLDSALGGEALTLMKVDVEGFETEVVNGAARTMESPSLLAVVMELGGLGSRYGYDEGHLHRRMLGWGFTPARYAPLSRRLAPVQERELTGGNRIYTRRMDELQHRLATAPRHRVHGTTV